MRDTGTPLRQGLRFRFAGAAAATTLPWWADALLLPLVNIVVAFIVCGVVVWLFVGANPLTVGLTMIDGAFGDANGIGTKADKVEAAAWYVLARRAGLSDPQMDIFFSSLSADEQKKAIERANKLR